MAAAGECGQAPIKLSCVPAAAYAVIDLLKVCKVVLLTTLQASRQLLQLWSIGVCAGSCLQLAKAATHALLYCQIHSAGVNV